MKNIVLKLPTAIFIMLVLLPVAILTLQMIAGEELLEAKYYGTLMIVGSVVASIWLFSIVDYFQSKIEGFKYTRLIYILLGLDLTLDLLFEFVEFSESVYVALNILRVITYITAVVFITLLIHKVFYERAVWFIVLEVLIVIVGISTLTPEIKRNEKELLAKDFD